MKFTVIDYLTDIWSLAPSSSVYCRPPADDSTKLEHRTFFYYLIPKGRAFHTPSDLLRDLDKLSQKSKGSFTNDVFTEGEPSWSSWQQAGERHETGRPHTERPCQGLPCWNSSWLQQLQSDSLLDAVGWYVRPMPKCKLPNFSGFQMAALNLQTRDEGCHINSAFFEQNFGCGYVLKPVQTIETDNIYHEYHIISGVYAEK